MNPKSNQKEYLLISKYIMYYFSISIAFGALSEVERG